VILVEGPSKSGRTWTALTLSTSPRVGRTFVFEFADAGGSGDEYAALGRYELVVLDGGWDDFIAKLQAAADMPTENGRPNVIVIDSVTALWDDLKWWAESRARRSRRGQAALAADPDAAVEVSTNYWNDAKSRWGLMLHILNQFEGIAVVIARADEVTAFENGQPVEGKTVYRVDAEKSLTANVTAVVRVTPNHDRLLMAARSSLLVVPPSGLTLPPEGTLDFLVFDLLLGGRPKFAKPRRLSTRMLSSSEAKPLMLRRLVEGHGIDKDIARDAAHTVWVARNPRNADISEESLPDLIAEAVRVATAPPPGEAAPVGLTDDEVAAAQAMTVVPYKLPEWVELIQEARGGDEVAVAQVRSVLHGNPLADATDEGGEAPEADPVPEAVGPSGEEADSPRAYEEAADDEHDATEDVSVGEAHDPGDDEDDSDQPQDESHDEPSTPKRRRGH